MGEITFGAGQSIYILPYSYCQYSVTVMDPAKIADCELIDPVTKEVTTFGALWQDQTCVIVFLRRFG